jgi:hypothetical protein
MMATFVDAFFLLAQSERRETKRTASSAARSLSLQPTSSACTTAEKEEHAKRKRACTAARQAKRVAPAPECVAATAEEKTRREGRRVRRPARYDD